MYAGYLLGLILSLFFPQITLTVTQAPNKDCALAGSVINGATGAGVKKATVVARNVQGIGTYQTTTDSSGGFAFSGVAPGQYNLYAEHVDFLGSAYESKGPTGTTNTVPVAAGQTVNGIVVRLTPAAAVSGRVMDEDGDPLPRANVSAYQSQWGNGRNELAVRGSVGTDDLGQYRIFGLQPGKYFLAATLPNYSHSLAGTGDGTSGASTTEQTYVPTYYPGTTDPGSAQAIELRPGDDIGSIEFSVLPVKAVQLRGRLVNGVAGIPIQGGCVNLQPQGGSNDWGGLARYACTEDAQGDFIIHGIVPGSYSLVANFNQQSHPMSARLAVQVDEGGADGVIVDLLPSVEVAGHVRFEGESPVKPENLWLTLVPVDLPEIGGAGSQPSSDGSFKIPDVAQGVYRVRLNGWGDLYLKSATLGGRENADESFTVNRDTPSSTLEVVLSARAGHIEGTVVDDQKKPVANAFVVFVPDPNRRNREDLFRENGTNQEGQFVLAGIPPGEYTLLAWLSPQGVQYRNPDWLAQYETRGTAVRVSEATRLNLQVRAIPLDDSPH